MRKIVWTFGIIAGVICAGMFYLDIPEPGSTMDFENGQLWGYLTMILALSTIFFAVWQYRKQKGLEKIRFKTAFLIGLYITLIASSIYVIGWEVYFNLFASDFGDQYIAYQRQLLIDQGKSTEEIESILSPQMETMSLYGSNRLFRMAMTFLEIFPVGLLISLLVATLFGAFLKPKSALKRSGKLTV